MVVDRTDRDDVGRKKGGKGGGENSSLAADGFQDLCGEVQKPRFKIRDDLRPLSGNVERFTRMHTWR